MRLMAVLLVSFLGLVSCSGSPNGAPKMVPAPTSAVALPGVVVDAAWLSEHAASVRIIDVRGYETFLKGHIPGAVHMGARSLNKGRDLAPSDVVVQRFSDAGIRRDFTVVVYGSHEDYRPPARVLWALELHGHDRVAVLNGGIEGWKAAGQSVSAEPLGVVSQTFEPAMRSERLATTDNVVQAISEPETILFDSRGASDYAGTSGKKFAPRHGHIPTAVNVPSAAPIVEVNGVRMLPDVAVLQEVYNQHLQSSTKAITYCNGGNAASVGYLELRMLGVDVAMYDGSWGAWSVREDLPMATGAEPGDFPK